MADNEIKRVGNKLAIPSSHVIDAIKKLESKEVKKLPDDTLSGADSLRLMDPVLQSLREKNYSEKEIAAMVSELIPGIKEGVVRTYLLDSRKIKEELEQHAINKRRGHEEGYQYRNS